MSRRALICGVIGAGALAGGLLWLSGTGTQAPRDADGLARIGFLDAAAEDASASDVTLILHPLATGDGPRAVLDPAVIRAARGRAYYSDTPDAQAQGDALDTAFISILRDGAVAEVLRCASASCQAATSKRDLAGLLDASQPMERITESFAHHEQARKRHWKLLNDPATVLIEPPNLPAPSTIVYPARVTLDLPTIVLGTDARTADALDLTEYRARLAAAFAHAYPDTQAYRLGEITVTPRMIGDVTLLTPSISVEVIPSLATRLLGPDPFADMPAFSPALAPPDRAIPLPVPSVDAIIVTEAAPTRYTLSYYRIARDEPTAQQ